MKEPNKKLLRIAAFIAAGFVLFSVVFFLINKGAKNSDLEQTGKVNKIANHSVDPDLIIFGSSVSEVGVSPSIITAKTGLSAYNCSIDGTRFLQYKGLIDEFTEYSKKNQYVVLVETYFSFETVDALTQVENFIPQINNSNIYNALYKIQPDVVWRSRYVPFYKYTVVTSRFYKNVAIGWKNILGHKSNNDTSNGYNPVNRHWEADADEAIRQTAAFNIQLNAGIIAEYKKTIQRLGSKGKKVFIILTPMYTEMLKRITDITPLRIELKKIAAETNVAFLDFSQSGICNQKDFFYNSNHLNIDGSKQFSSVLADSINQFIKKQKL